MGLISVVKQFARLAVDGVYTALITHDPGNGDSGDSPIFGPSGDDSPPLPEDFVLLVDSPGAGRQNVAGCADTRNEGVAEPGEVRRYARDPDGAIVATIWMKGDGTIWIANANGGVIEMASSGDVSINGVVIDLSGNVIAPGEVTAMDGPASVSLSTHTHPDAMGGTGAPVPGS